MKSKRRRTSLTAKEVVDLASNLRNKLTQLGVKFDPDAPIDGVPVHLADIYEVSVTYQCLIDRLVELSPSQKEQAKNLVDQIDYHLYEHLPYHLKHLSKAFDDLMKHLGRKGTTRSKKK